MSLAKYVVPLQEVGIGDAESIGIRSAMLGEMMQHPGNQGINIANGFLVTALTYRQFLLCNHLEPEIRKCLLDIAGKGTAAVRNASMKIRRLIMKAAFPPELEWQLVTAYNKLSAQFQVDDAEVALYPSVIDEDISGLLLAPKQQIYTNVRGSATLLETIKHCFAALFTTEAISYRDGLGLRHFNTGLSVCVQKMIRPGLAAAGLACSLDIGGQFTGAVAINGAYGPAALLKIEEVTPDEFIVLRSGAGKPGVLSIPVIEKRMGDKSRMIIYGDHPSEGATIIPTEKGMQCRYCLTDEQILRLAEWVNAVKKCTYQKGYWVPMNIEWAIDGRTNEMFIVGVQGQVPDFRKKIAMLKSLIPDPAEMAYS